MKIMVLPDDLHTYLVNKLQMATFTGAETAQWVELANTINTAPNIDEQKFKAIISIIDSAPANKSTNKPANKSTNKSNDQVSLKKQN